MINFILIKRNQSKCITPELKSNISQIPILILFMFISSFVFSQNTFSEDTMIICSDSILKINDKRIDPTKTKEIIEIKKGNIKVTEYFDNQNLLVKKTTKSLNSTAPLSGSRTEVFDVDNNVILEKNQDQNGIIWYLSLLKYDNGQLITKTTYNFNTIYKAKYVIGRGKKETYTIFYNTKGEVVKSNDLQKRIKPYIIN